MDKNFLSKKNIFMLGAGGHAKVLLATSELLENSITGVADKSLEGQAQTWNNIPIIMEHEILGYNPHNTVLINGIGKILDNSARKNIYLKFQRSDFTFLTIIHPHTWIAKSTSIKSGAQIMAGAIIQPNCVIGENTIINSNTTIDHDTVIGSNTHIAPGVCICGNVEIGDDVFIGAGSTIINNISIKNGSIIRAGSLISKNII